MNKYLGLISLISIAVLFHYFYTETDKPLPKRSSSQTVKSNRSYKYSVPKRQAKFNGELLKQLLETPRIEDQYEPTLQDDTGDEVLPMRVIIYVEDEDGPLPYGGILQSDSCGLGHSINNGYLEIELSESCDLFASKMDGIFRSFTNIEWVVFEPGVEMELDFYYPLKRTGGLGVHIQRVDQGFAILSVLPNSPAEDLGLMIGDIITEVNSVETRELSTSNFIRLTTGPEGSTAEFRLLGDETNLRTFTRMAAD